MTDLGDPATGLLVRREYSISQPTIVFTEPENPWGRISEIAAKVGVGPHVKGGPATIVATGHDGNTYDVWEVLAAVLDRLAKD